jgi:bacteriocin biosynthesis cyclodehydratase domain-containing protein
MRSPSGVRDQFNPAARVLWRGEHSVQLEIGEQAVILDGITEHAMRALTFRGPADPDARRPIRDPLAGVRRTLHTRGLLWERSEDDDDPRFATDQPRLASELSALTAAHGERGAELLSARRHSSVAVHGTGRAGSVVAAVLAAAGVGRTYMHSLTEARQHHAAPGGVVLADEGTPLATATAAAVRRLAPDAETSPPPNGARPDLVILACDEPVEQDRRDALHAQGVAHLPVMLRPSSAIIGPLVIPGLTSCLRCADLYRLDRDPAWNALAVQLQAPRRPRDGSPVALTTAAAGIAAMQALAFLDGEDPASIEGTLELHLPDFRLRRRTRPQHPDCDCGTDAIPAH